MSKPLDKELYEKITNEAKQKFKVWPSIYASSWLVSQYKKRGGRFSPKTNKSVTKGIDRWMREKWINVCELPKKVPCGRKKISKSWKTDYPVCRPSVRVNSKTPTLSSDISNSEIKKICKEKRRSPLKKLKKIKSKKKSNK